MALGTIASYPPSPDAVSAANPLAKKNEFTGMVFCPPCFSHLAVMACWQWQKVRKCGRTCPNAVKETEVVAVVAAATQNVDAKLADMPAAQQSLCPVCGGMKTPEAKRCVHCRGRKLRTVHA